MNTGLTYKAVSSVQDDREGPLFGKIIKISGRAECLTQMFKQRDWFGPAGRPVTVDTGAVGLCAETAAT